MSQTDMSQTDSHTWVGVHGQGLEPCSWQHVSHAVLQVVTIVP